MNRRELLQSTLIGISVFSGVKIVSEMSEAVKLNSQQNGIEDLNTKLLRNKATVYDAHSVVELESTYKAEHVVGALTQELAEKQANFDSKGGSDGVDDHLSKATAYTGVLFVSTATLAVISPRENTDNSTPKLSPNEF